MTSCQALGSERDIGAMPAFASTMSTGETNRVAAALAAGGAGDEGDFAFELFP